MFVSITLNRVFTEAFLHLNSKNKGADLKLMKLWLFFTPFHTHLQITSQFWNGWQWLLKIDDRGDKDDNTNNSIDKSGWSEIYYYSGAFLIYNQ